MADSADGLVGNGLPYKQKSLFQASLGTDLSSVRVRTDGAAAKVAEQHNARAVAVGEEINFAEGQYQPDTPKGDRLLAHEVAHTVQQRDAARSGEQKDDGELKTTTPGDSAEKGADTAAAAMVQGKAASVESTDLAIAKKGMDEDVAPPGEGAPGPDANADPDAARDPNAPATANADGKEGELEGDLVVERTGTEEVEGTEPVGPPQNLEAGKQAIAAKAKDLPPDGGAEELKAGGPQVEGGGGGGGGGDVQMTEDIQLAIEVAQADAKEGASEAKAEADAYKAAMNAERDRFDAQQEALALEQLKAMAPADKRSTLIEMGYDEKSVKKMKDAELDGVISGKLAAENRKTRILGMDAEELRALSPDRKMQFLVDLGVDRGDLQKIGMAKTTAAFDQVMAKAHVPGQHKVKIKIKGGFIGIGKKEWEIKLDVDGEGNPEFDVQKKGGWLSKLWGWVKAALPIIALVLAPLTGGASLVALAVYQTVTAIASGDWLGAIIGVAGAVVGIGAIKAISSSASNAANAFKKVADVAGKVKNVALAAKASMIAAKAKSPGGLLAALATGASAFADFAAKSAENFAKTMRSWAEKLDKWSRVISGGEQVVQGIKSGDPAAAVAGAFEGAAAAVSKPQKQADGSTKETSKTATNLEKYSRIATYASVGQRAAKSQPPDYGGVVDAAMNIAGEFKTGSGFEKAQRLTSAASRLTRAIQTKNPGEIAAAMLGVAEAIQLAKIGSDPEADAKDGKTPDEQKAEITKRYAKATAVVRSASAALTAAAAKPRPNYPAALEATMQLIADLTESKKLDQAAVLTKSFDAWTAAVRSKDENAILNAGIMFGQAINDMRDIIHAERDEAKKAAQAQKAPDEPEGDDGGLLPSIPLSPLDLSQLPGTIINLSPYDTPASDGPAEPTATVTTSEEFAGLVPNYTVVPGDTFYGIAQRFDTSVSLLQSANPNVDPRKLRIGMRIFVPGADKMLTPRVTTSVDWGSPGDPNGPNVTVPPTGQGPNMPDSGNSAWQLPADLQTVLDITRAMVDTAKYFGHPGAEATYVSWEKIVKAYDTFNKKDATVWEKIRADLIALRSLGDFKVAWGKEFNLFRQYFQNVDETEASKLAARQGLQTVRRFKANIARVLRFGGIFTTFSSAADHVVEAAGYKKDLSGAEASVRERTEAAALLITEVPQLVSDVQWAYGMASRIAARLGVGQAFEGYNIVARAANRYGDDVAKAVMKYVAPSLEKMAATNGAQWATQAATRAAAALSSWGAEFAASTSSQLFRQAANTLTSKLGGALRFGVAPQFVIAFEIAKLEAEFAAHLYNSARSSLNIILSQKMYGSMIQMKKAEIRGWGVYPNETADETIRKCYTAFASAEKSDIRQGWPAFAQQELARRGKWYAPHASSSQTLLAALREYWISKGTDAQAVKDALLTYIDTTFRQVFNAAPPA